MSFLEVMAALAILAIFGSSLFMMQAYLLQRMSNAQLKLIADMRMQNELSDYQLSIIKDMIESDGKVAKSLEKKEKAYTSPDMLIEVTTASHLGAQTSEKINSKESPFKKFKNLHLIAVNATQDKQQYGSLYRFIYIPQESKT